MSLVIDGRQILSNVVYSQMETHSRFGGVIPEVAARAHVEALLPVLKETLEKAGLTLKEIDLIAVAMGPGLVGPIMVGLSAAKALSWSLGIPYVGVSHVEAHLYSALMGESSISFPLLGAVLSGGHTTLTLIPERGVYEVIGKTVDDAIGEAFDKVAKMLKLPYPGGPEIEKLALLGKPGRFSFSGGRVKKNPFDFSFSGLKTAVLYAMKEVQSEQDKRDLAFSFQETALLDVVEKVILAAEKFSVKRVLLGGGVTASKRLRTLFAEKGSHLEYCFPPEGLSLDNAAMIAGLGFERFSREPLSAALDLEPVVSMHL